MAGGIRSRGQILRWIRRESIRRERLVNQGIESGHAGLIAEKDCRIDVLWTVVLIISVVWRSSRHVGAERRREISK